LSDAKAATDRIEKDKIVLIPTPELKMKGYAPTVVVTEKADSTIDNLRSVAESDPNLALVGFRIEVEKRIKRLAELNGLSTERRGLHRLIRDLNERKVLSASATGGLLDLVVLANQAAHGAEVTRDAADWVLDAGRSIFKQLDLSEDSNSNDGD